MPCHHVDKKTFLCVGNKPVRIDHNGRTYGFEWSGGCGWMPVNRDGNERLSPVPDGAWDALERAEKAGLVSRPGKKEKS